MDEEKGAIKYNKGYIFPSILIGLGVLCYGVARLIEKLPTSAENGALIMSAVGATLLGIKNYLNKQNEEQKVLTATAIDNSDLSTDVIENLVRIGSRLDRIVDSSEATHTRLEEHIVTTSDTHREIKSAVNQIKFALEEEKLSNKQLHEKADKRISTMEIDIEDLKTGHKEIISKLDLINANSKRIETLEERFK